MNPDRRFALSVTLNCVLAGAVAWLVFARSPSVHESATTHASGGGERHATAEKTPTTVVESTENSPATGTAEWPKWLKPIRTAGAPPHALASMVMADFERRWSARMADLQNQYQNGTIDMATLTRAMNRRDAEQEAELRAALGDADFREWDKEVTLRGFTPGGKPLSPTESDAVYDLQKALAAKRMKLDEANQRGEIDDEDVAAQMTAADKDYENQLKPILGDERFAALQTGPDESAAELRRQLRVVKADENQFKALLEIRRVTDELQSEVGMQAENAPAAGVDYEARRKAIEAARDREYERVLGPAGFASFQRDNDSRYQAMQRYAAAWKLEGQEIDTVFSQIQSYEKTLRDYRQQAIAAEQRGLPVDWDAVQRGVTQLSQQAEQTFRSTLGEDRFDKLKRNSVLNLGE
jgi:hypothetical protein